MGYQEFYVNSSGSNLNGGSGTGAATASDTAGTGTYTQGGGAGGGTSDLYAAASGTPFSGVSVGEYVSIYSGTPTTAAFVGRVTAINGGGSSIDIDSTKYAGTRPTNNTNYKAVVGGAWAGPSGSVAFPFAFIAATATDGSGNTPRVNFNGSFSITAAITHSVAGPTRFEGYTTTAGDGGKATLSSSTNSIAMLTLSGTNLDLVNWLVSYSGTAGTNSAITLSGAGFYCKGIAVNGARYSGILINANGVLVECEAYDCNKAGNASHAGITLNATTGPVAIRCVSHDNTDATNGRGFFISSTGTCIGCIADSNGADGFITGANPTKVVFLNCDAYNNSGDGIDLANTSASMFYIENCNLIKNGGYGINGSGAAARNGAVVNCGFGAGTQANTSGTTTGLKSMMEVGSVTYANDVTPWNNPANGDFRISLAAAKGVGRGTFATFNGSANVTVGYPDIGAAQHQETGGVFIPRATQVGF